jgi:glycosyltransferase involved in cell wall biosynthesis
VIDGENGFLLENPEPKELAAKIAELVKNSDLREKMGKASRQLYESNFTAETMSGQMRHVFQTVLSEACVE